MGKYLLLIAGVVVVYWLVRSSLRRRLHESRKESPSQSEDMVRCAQCGVHLPRGESLVVRDRYFCSVEHQRHHDGS